VEAEHLVGSARGLADLGDRQRRGVRGEDRVARRHRVELREHRVLDLHPLRHGLDHEVDLAEPVVAGRPGDQPERVRDVLLGLLGADLLLLDEPLVLPLGHLARLLQARVHELLIHVLEHHGDVGGRQHLGDLPAHDAGSDDPGFEYEHGSAP
jgi:hypothetical protein